MSNIFKYLKDNFFYMLFWRVEIWKEQKAEKKGLSVDYLKLWYLKKTGLPLNLEHPKSLTEKQQWLKLYGVTDLMVACTDKYRVRCYVSEKIGGEYLVPIIAIAGKDSFINAKEIDFGSLPQKFVIQCNHGAHMTHIVTKKNEMHFLKKLWLQYCLNHEMKINYAYTHGYELNYKNIEPRIFITECLGDGNVSDYKFMCFNGRVEYMWVDQDRFGKRKKAVFDKNFKKSPFRLGYDDVELKLDLYTCKKMKSLAEILARDFDLVRVDFYLEKNKIFFGELTFTSSSGVRIPNPEEWNEKLGKKLVLNGMI